MLTVEALQLHKTRLLQNKATALRILHTVEGALGLLDILITQETQGSADQSNQ